MDNCLTFVMSLFGVGIIPELEQTIKIEFSELGRAKIHYQLLIVITLLQMFTLTVISEIGLEIDI